MKNLKRNFFKLNKGAIMIEVLVAVALIVLITPMVYTRVSEYTQEIEDGAVASKLRLLKQGASTYMEANYESIADGTMKVKKTSSGTAEALGSLSGEEDTFTIDITDDELQRYVRPEYYTGSKMFETVKVAIKRKKVGETVVVNTIIATEGADGLIPENRGRRIASLAGSEAGYVTNNFAKGSGGFFDLDISDYFPTDTPENQVIVSTGYYPAEIKVTPTANAGDYLFRKDSAGYIEGTSNRMEGNIDFSKFAADGITVEGGYNIEEVGRIVGKKFDGDSSTLDKDAIEEFSVDDDGELSTDTDSFVTYGIDFKNKMALLDDIKIASLGGAKITDILPNLILMGVYQDISYGSYIPAPGYDNPRIIKATTSCPAGYKERYELIQKEALTGIDMVAVADHSSFLVSGDTSAHSMKSWLRNSKLLRSQYTKDGVLYSRLYGTDAEVLGECIGSGNNIKCATFEYVDNEPKLSEYCTNESTTIYDVSHTDNVINFSDNEFPFVEDKDNIAMWAKYDTNVFIFAKSSTSTQNAVVSVVGSNITCNDQNYCPGYKLGTSEASTGSSYAFQLMQHGNCQTALNSVKAAGVDFIPLDSGWTTVDGDGTAGDTSTTPLDGLAETNVDPSGGIYYNTRLFYKNSAGLDTPSCSGVGNIVNGGEEGLCVASDGRRISTLPVKYDLYYYCDKQ